MPLPFAVSLGRSLIKDAFKSQKKEQKKDAAQKAKPKVSGPKITEKFLGTKPKEENSDTPTTKYKPPTSSTKMGETGIESVDKSLSSIQESIISLRKSLKSSSDFTIRQKKIKRVTEEVEDQRKEEEEAENKAKKMAEGLKNKIGSKLAPGIDAVKNFFVQILIGSFLLWLKKNAEELTKKVKEFADEVQKIFDKINDDFIQPLWNLAKAIVGPIVTEISKIIIPDFVKENKDISDNLNELIKTVPVVGEQIEKIQEAVRSLKADIPEDKLKEGQKKAEEMSGSTPSTTAPSTTATTQTTTTTETTTSPTDTGPTGTTITTPSETQPSTSTSGGDYETKLAKVLGNYEGLELTAYADANYGWEIPTIGIGATKYPPGFRLKGKVKKGDVITEEEAYMIKAHDIKEHRQRLLREIPGGVYNKLPDGVKAALESKVFNYGSLGGTLAGLVTEASKTGNYKPVADYFRNVLANHNGGINSWRRNDEAGMIMTGKSGRVGVNFGASSTPPAQVAPAVRPQSPMMGEAYSTGLKTGASQHIGGSSAYHIDTKFPADLPVEKAVAMVDQMSRAYAKQGREIEFSNAAVSGLVYDHNAPYAEKLALLKRVFGAHAPRGGWRSMDYYIPLKSDAKGRFGKSAEAAEIVTPTIPGGKIEYHEGGRYGAFVVVVDENGNVISKTGHGDIRGSRAGTVIDIPKGTNIQSQGVGRSASYEKRGGGTIVVPVGSGGSNQMSGSSGGSTTNPPTQGRVNNSWWTRLTNMRLFKGG